MFANRLDADALMIARCMVHVAVQIVILNLTLCYHGYYMYKILKLGVCILYCLYMTYSYTGWYIITAEWISSIRVHDMHGIVPLACKNLPAYSSCSLQCLDKPTTSANGSPYSINCHGVDNVLVISHILTAEVCCSVSFQAQTGATAAAVEKTGENSTTCIRTYGKPLVPSKLNIFKFANCIFLGAVLYYFAADL